MRTTITLPDDVYQAARSLAHHTGTSLGDAVASLVRRGLDPGPMIDLSGPFPRFVLPPNAEPITLEQTLEAEDEL